MAAKARTRPRRAPARGEDEALGEHLADERRAAGTQGGAHGELFAAGGGAGEQQVGEVDADDEQDEADRAPEHDERAAELPLT